MNTSHNFVLRSATSGGVVVEKFERKSLEPETIGAFTTPADMITWLAEQYGLQSHPTPKPETTVSLTVDAPADPDWTPWNGGALPECIDHDAPCMIRMRNGTERVGKAWDRYERWNWRENAILLENDVVAYRLI